MRSTFKTEIPYYSTSRILSEDERKRIAISFMATGTFESGTLEQWQSFIITQTVLLLPELGTKILCSDTCEFIAIPFSNDFLDSLHQIDDITTAYEGGEYSEENEEDATIAIASTFPNYAILPTPNFEKFTTRYKTMGTLTSMYGHLSLVCYLAGKRAIDMNHNAITFRLPDAIERKYNESNAALTGTMQLSRLP